MHDNSDHLLTLVRGGDATALGQYIEDHRPQLLAYIERRLGTALRRKIEPDDVLQEVAADAVRNLETIDLADREPFSWLCQLAERRIVDAHRHFFAAQKRDARREAPLGSPGGQTNSPALIDLLAASMTTPSKVFSRNVREARLTEALAALPEEQREALRLRYVENRPSKEIAAELGKSDAAVRVMLTRALKRLESLLGEA